MHIINKNNYEEYALDYLEGKLSPEQEQAMEQFLLEHPSIKEEIEGVEKMVLVEDESITYPYKKNLKKASPFYNTMLFKVAAAIVFLIIATVVYVNMDSTAVQTDKNNYAQELNEDFKNDNNEKNYDSGNEKIDTADQVFDNLASANVGPENNITERKKDKNSVEKNASATIAASEESSLNIETIPLLPAEQNITVGHEKAPMHYNNLRKQKNAIAQLDSRELNEVTVENRFNLRGPDVYYQSSEVEALNTIATTLDSIRKNVDPYLEIAEDNGLISENMEKRKFTLESIAQAFIPESFKEKINSN